MFPALDEREIRDCDTRIDYDPVSTDIFVYFLKHNLVHYMSNILLDASEICFRLFLKQTKQNFKKILLR